MLKKIACFLCSMGCALLFASELSVNPVRLYVSKDEPITTLTLKNNGQKTVLVQLTPLRWLQAVDAIKTVDTGDLLVTPVIFQLPPQKSQLIRIAFKAKFDARYETTYRLLVSELPIAEISDKASGLHVLLQLSLPVFAEPIAPIRESLIWRIQQKDGQTWLNATNTGNTVVLLNAISGKSLQGQAFAIGKKTGLDYLFPGTSKRWLLTQKIPKTLSVFVNQKQQTFTVLPA